jgi:hypothetical protein
MQSAGEAPVTMTNVTPVKLIPVKLLKNYRASGVYEIVEDAPPPVPGVAFVTKDKDGKETGRKLWADTVVALPRDEAARLLNNEAVSMESVLGSDGKPQRNAKGDIIRTVVKRKFPLAERADPLPV